MWNHINLLKLKSTHHADSKKNLVVDAKMPLNGELDLDILVVRLTIMVDILGGACFI